MIEKSLQKDINLDRNIVLISCPCIEQEALTIWKNDNKHMSKLYITTDSHTI